MTQENIVIKGARVHNLKNIDITIPRDKFVVITGLSGSGKSSLAFDTIYAEGQRRYVESLSAYARQFLGQMDKPDVDSIEGLSPAISIDQKSTSKNPRSTVGTITEIYDYLRLLFARVGKAYCPEHKIEIKSQTIDQMVDRIQELPEGTRAQILAPVVKERKGTHAKVLEGIVKAGYTRVRINTGPSGGSGEIIDLSEGIPRLNAKNKYSIQVVVDRIIIKEGIASRLADSLETALKLSEGEVVLDVSDGEDILFSQNLACRECGFAVEKISPQLFSFNSPLGACPTCTGLGYRKELDPELIINDRELSLSEGAIDLDLLMGHYPYFEVIQSICAHFDIDMKIPFEDLDKDKQDIILYGADSNFLISYLDEYGRKRELQGRFAGLIETASNRYNHNHASDVVKQKIESFMSVKKCPSCKGMRLKPEALAILIAGSTIYEITNLPIAELFTYFQDLSLSETDAKIAQQILKELKDRVKFLVDVGLGYLTLSRPAGTLSGGESQRIRLATQIGSSLTGVLYVLDEPSIGLHQRDNDRLLESLRQIRDLGNSLIVVEHDEETIAAADYIIDIGPGAGIHGGTVTAQGTPQELIDSSESITALYLKGSKFIEVPKERRLPNGRWLTISGAKQNNLQNIDVNIPVGMFVCVTGVSGSGKSTLINEIMLKALYKKLHRSKTKPGQYSYIEGIEHFDKIISVDQSPIGRTPRSNPITYVGAFDYIRELFAMTKEARIRGYKKGRFSFNVKGGRCDVCNGDGTIKIEMHFLPDVYITCEACNGKRYSRETLEVKYKGKTISDILDMTVEEALLFFQHIPRVERKMQTLYDVGLSYMKLGQSAVTLSGGEAQRIKLASELHKRSTGRTLYVLDEPTTGLHTDDVAKLLEILKRFVQNGDTVLVIEHNLDVIKTADYIIDLGPEGGKEGGQVVAIGTPEDVAQNPHSYTGGFLKKVLF